MDILFVPFGRTKNSYLRAPLLKHDRENECYVMICGSVGNLPQVESLDIRYAQSSVFSPSILPFRMTQLWQKRPNRDGFSLINR